eukprot:4245956-Amphidinium_carterae.2
MDADLFVSLCQHIGLDPDEPFRTLAFMSSDWLQEVLSQWRNAKDMPVSPALLSQAGLLGRTARILAGFGKSVAEVEMENAAVVFRSAVGGGTHHINEESMSRKCCR